MIRRLLRNLVRCPSTCLVGGVHRCELPRWHTARQHRSLLDAPFPVEWYDKHALPR